MANVMKARSSFYISLILFILVLSTVFRFYGLDRLSLWSDELWVVMDSTQGTVWEMLQRVYEYDNHPPGYYLLLRYTQFFFGSSDFAIRFPSAVTGVALVAATFVTGRKHFSWEAAIIAATLVAGSYQAIYYSQEARPNVFMALFALLAFHYFRAVILEGDGARKNTILFWVFASFSSYFHYSGLIFCLCLGLIYLLFALVKQNKKTFMAGIVLFLPFVLIYLPWVFGTFHDLVNSPAEAWQRTPDFNTLKTTFWFLFGPDDPRVFFYQTVFFGTLIILLASRFLLSKNKKYLLIKEDKYSLILCTFAMIVLPVAVFFIKSVFSQDAYNHRHFLYAVPLMALLAGYFIHEIIRLFSEKNQVKVFVSVLSFIILYQIIANDGRALYTANHFKEEYREGAKVVADDVTFLSSADHAIVSSSSFFDHYLNRFMVDQHQSDFIYDEKGKIRELQVFLASRHIKEFYYLETPLIPGANKMITSEDMVLFEHYQPLCRTRFSRVQAFRFSVENPVLKSDFLNLPTCPRLSL